MSMIVEGLRDEASQVAIDIGTEELMRGAGFAKLMEGMYKIVCSGRFKVSGHSQFPLVTRAAWKLRERLSLFLVYTRIPMWLIVLRSGSKAQSCCVIRGTLVPV